QPSARDSRWHFEHRWIDARCDSWSPRRRSNRAGSEMYQTTSPGLLPMCTSPPTDWLSSDALHRNLLPAQAAADHADRADTARERVVRVEAAHDIQRLDDGLVRHPATGSLLHRQLDEHPAAVFAGAVTAHAVAFDERLPCQRCRTRTAGGLSSQS